MKHIPGTRAPLEGVHHWHVLIEATTPRRASRIYGEIEELLGAALEEGHVADAVIAASEAQAEAFWKIRDFISEAERAEGQTLAHDISVPVAEMPGFLATAAARSKQAFPGVSASGFGHLGDGNIHFHVRAGSRAARRLV